MKSYRQWLSELRTQRRGVFIVVMAVSLSAILGFVAFSVDTGLVVLTQTRMQNTVDAAALAAASEITYAVQNAGSNVGDVTVYAMDQARLKAQQLGTLNDIYIDPAVDVRFGRRTMTSPGNYVINWDVTPANAVKVTARRTHADTSRPDGKLKTMFASVFGPAAVGIQAEATAYIESRDIGLVLDFSGSMNDDSCYDVLATRNRAQLDANMQDIFNVLDTERNLGNMVFTPQWFNQSVTSGTRSGTVTFKNTSIDFTSSAIATGGIQLRFTDNSTETKSPTATSGTYARTGTARTINRVTMNFRGTLAPGTASATVSGRTATVTFNNNTSNVVSVSTSSNMTEIRLNYQGGTNATSTFSGTRSRSVTGSGLYVSSVRVNIGGTLVTVNNPAGTSAPASFSPVSLVFEPTSSNVQTFLGLSSVAYPWGSGSWSEFITYCQSDSQIISAGHQHKYGGACLVNYLLRSKPTYSQCNDLWRTPHYPFHSVKQGAMLFCDFIQDLGFGDEVGAVSYDVTARREQSLNYDGYNIDESGNPISANYESVRQIVRHRQAAHYSSNTNIGGGIVCGKQMLDASKRLGTQPTLLIMTDGQPTAQDSGWTFPADWNWGMFDYDGDGSGDYYTSDSDALYALMRAKECVDAGYTIHTMTVGLGADPSLMKAIAHMGKGITIVVPGNQSVAEMEEEVIAGFQKIAAFVPPAKLVKPE
jgi:Flp pilus assembly protein TadG